MVRHPHFTQPIFVRFPRPAVLGGREGVERFPAEPEPSLEVAVTRTLRSLDPSVTLEWVKQAIVAAPGGRRTAGAQSHAAGAPRGREGLLPGPVPVPGGWRIGRRAPGVAAARGRRGRRSVWLLAEQSETEYDRVRRSTAVACGPPPAAVCILVLCRTLSYSVVLCRSVDSDPTARFLHSILRPLCASSTSPTSTSASASFSASRRLASNQREADVAQSFTRAIDKVIALAPDLILIGGDVFHTVRPTNPAILHAFRQFSRLRAALPDAIDRHGRRQPRHAALDARRGASCACSAARRSTSPTWSARAAARSPTRSRRMLAVPDLPPGSVGLSPDLACRHNVLLLHGEVEGVLPEGAREDERAAMPIPASDLPQSGGTTWRSATTTCTARWRPNACYCGSLDYTSTKCWGEIAEERASQAARQGARSSATWPPASRRFHRCR